MQTLIIIFFAILGLIIGSFLNVVIFRMNTGMGIGGRSKCLSCGKQLNWYEMIPVFSFLAQRGKCAHCGSKISWQYPIVEATAGILFAAIGGIYLHLLFSGFVLQFFASVLFWLIFVSIAIVISAYDARHTIIPIGALVSFLIVCLIGGLFGGMAGIFLIPAHWYAIGLYAVTNHVLGAIIVPLPFFLLWLVSRGRLIGFGDIEIMSGIGFLFGVISGFSAVTLAFWVGTVFVILLIAAKSIAADRFSVTRVIPFAPFLFVGAFLVGVLGLDLFTVLLRMH